MTTTTDRTDTISRPADVGTTDSGVPTTAHPADRPQFLAARARLAPVFAWLAETAAERDRERVTDREATDRLAAAGFPGLRVPEDAGGAGLTFPEAARLYVELAEADSNVLQALRVHVVNVETVLGSPDGPRRERWLHRFATGETVANATTEIGNRTGHYETRLTTRPDGSAVINGRKAYSTGTLYADWTIVVVEDEDGAERAATVRSDAPGVTRHDDWDGFGQRLSASGTTEFTDVVVDPEELTPVGQSLDDGSSIFASQAIFQFVHLVGLTGIARAVVRDAAAYVAGRTRGFSHGAAPRPGDDPQVLQVVGELEAAAFGAQAALDAVVGPLDRALRAEAAGAPLAEAEVDAVYTAVYAAQQVIARAALDAATRLFEVGGASATLRTRGLDRHWRNARVLASHNPLIYRARLLGDRAVNGTPLERHYRLGG
ncbi:acyl-CoA dehydrogenase family protein [Micrococcus luteus]|uniref:acyl-CoA dehydrogenase family protein n=1 Tax=Micrococcus luteus TaxID=1270 RepID=UPI0020CBD02C|nr:acyl-CoA dehydrogenase family protein [Micrococcus luteus]UTT45482.1 acyl-CoA dehydrogenase family protein [Micrococcus luteus]